MNTQAINPSSSANRERAPSRPSAIEAFSADVPLQPGVNHLQAIARRRYFPPPCHAEGNFTVEALACDPSLNGPEPGPTPGAQIVFRAVAPSAVTLADGSTEPLLGTLLVSRCASPNTFFAARVEKIQLASASVAITSGCSAIGHIEASTLYGGAKPTEFWTAVRIGDELLPLSGDGPYDFTVPPRLDVELTVGTFRVHLVAVIEVQLNPDGAEPYCSRF